MTNTPHAVLVDYDSERREAVTRALKQDSGVCVHGVSTRSEAIGVLWSLAAHGIFPRAILSAWLLEDPEAREFYSLISREIDHTCLTLLKHCARIDEQHNAVGQDRTSIVCYAPTDLLGEALYNIQEEGLGDRVAVIDAEDFDELERSVKQLYQRGNTCLTEADQAESYTTSAKHRALRRLSR